MAPGKRVLKEMKRDNPGRTLDERADFDQGLRSRLHQLKGQPAEAKIPVLIAFRREFLNDASKILELGPEPATEPGL